jgi:hypothetical protein
MADKGVNLLAKKMVEEGGPHKQFEPVSGTGEGF